MTIKSKDTLKSRIPSHILESYPRFYDFLKAYYEWLSMDENPHGHILNHMDYISFEKSLDEYTEFMKYEYLNGVPNDILIDKELFIRWSKKFNKIRGSHESYKFLFRLLFNEQSTEIYIPKENILRLSDGNWISGESTMYITHSDTNINDFQYQVITQTRPVYEDIVETATALVQRVRTRYAGRYIVTELSISNIKGTFEEGYPVVSSSGVEEWIIKTITDYEIQDGGQNYQTGQRLIPDTLEYFVERNALQEEIGFFDTRTTTFFKIDDIEVYVNDTLVSQTGYTFDGRIVTSSLIEPGDKVKVQMIPYQGYIVVDSIDNGRQSIGQINIIDSPIAVNQTSLTSSGLGSGLTATISSGLAKPIKGYYEGNKGQLSSDMYLQDSLFYQEYSYAIRTEQDLTAYSDIVKKLLHPAGFLLFGQLGIIQMVELILEYSELDITYQPVIVNVLHKYGQGVNYRSVHHFKNKTSNRLYAPGFFDSLDQDYLNGEPGYNLESKFLSRIKGYEYSDLKGWMNKGKYSDYYLYVPQDYSDVLDSGNLYFETGYVSERTQ